MAEANAKTLQAMRARLEGYAMRESPETRGIQNGGVQQRGRGGAGRQKCSVEDESVHWLLQLQDTLCRRTACSAGEAKAKADKQQAHTHRGQGTVWTVLMCACINRRSAHFLCCCCTEACGVLLVDKSSTTRRRCRS